MARKNKYASMFYLRSDGLYTGSYYISGEDGKRHRKQLYDRDPENLFYRLEEAKAAASIDIDSLEPEHSFLDATKKWEREKWDNIKPGTQVSYAKPLERAKEEFGDLQLSKIEPYMVQRHLDRLACDGKSVSTIKTQRVIYRILFRYAINSKEFGKWISRNPAESVSIPGNAKPKAKREAPEDDIVKLIQSRARTAYWGEFAMFLLCTGLRRGEALAVQWKDIDLKARTITISKQASFRGSQTSVVAPKTEAGTREVPILAPLLPFLKRPKGAKGTDYLFHGDNPSLPIPDSGYRRHWEHYCKDMGFWAEDFTGTKLGANGHTYNLGKGRPTLTAHQLRHGYASMLFEAGVDVYTAQKLMGHANIETTMGIYTHLRNKQKNKSINFLLEHTKDGL